MSTMHGSKIRIGAFCVDTALDEVSRDGIATKLEPRTMRVLAHLAASPGQVVSVDDLLNQVWTDVVVTPDSVYQAIAALRRALNDDPKDPRYLVNVPRRGYRLIAPVEPWDAPTPQPSPVPLEDTPPPSPSLAAGDKGENPNPSTSAGRIKRGTGALVSCLVAFAVIGVTKPWQTHHIGAASSSTGPAGARADRAALAVLPFVNLSADPNQAFFADGVAEEILTLLSDVSGVRVTSRTSSFSYRDKQLDLPTIAGRLGVSYVVEGSVRRADDHVRVSAQLIDVASDTKLWSQTYERKLDDVFAIQADVASKIVRSLQIAVGADEVAALGRRPTKDIEAWQRFLKARNHLRNRTSSVDLEAALSDVDAAITLDPSFARAYSLRALVLTLLPHWKSGAASLDAARAAGLPVSAREQQLAALQAAERALQLEPQLGEPYFVRAELALSDNRYETADLNYREALRRAPGNPDTHNAYSIFLLASGYLAEGFAQAEQAAAIDPLSPLIAWQMAYAGLITGRFEVIERYSDRARENGWSGWQAVILPGGASLMHGDFDRAERIMVAALPDRADKIRMALAAIRRQRIDNSTRAMLDRLEPYGPPGLGRFATEVMAGDIDAALATISGTVAADSLLAADGTGGPPRPSSGDVSEMVIEPDWWFPPASAMRRDPRFAQLVRRIGLVEFWRKKGWPDLCQPKAEQVICH